jgi:transcriptional regulator with XRE-family HTH domain
MILRPNPKQLVRRIKEAQKVFGLNQDEMAAELRITPEWLSNIMHGHHKPSYNILLRFHDFLRRNEFPANASLDAEVSTIFARQPTRRTSHVALHTQIRLSFSRLIVAARNKPARLAWIVQHLRAIPPEWKKR